MLKKFNLLLIGVLFTNIACANTIVSCNITNNYGLPVTVEIANCTIIMQSGDSWNCRNSESGDKFNLQYLKFTQQNTNKQLKTLSLKVKAQNNNTIAEWVFAITLKYKRGMLDIIINKPDNTTTQLIEVHQSPR